MLLEEIQSCNDYAGLDSGGEMLQGWKRGARSMGSGRLGSIAQRYKQASNRRIRASAKIKISRLVNQARGFFVCVAAKR